MYKLRTIAAGIAITLASATTSIASVVNISLTDNLGSILATNSPLSTANITTVAYSFGAASDGIATWDTDAKGGTRSDILVGSTPSTTDRFFQTVTWSGLSVAPNDSFKRLNLDVDMILTLSPLSVAGLPFTEILTDALVSLSNAFVSIFWSDGSSGTTLLFQRPWSEVQNFEVTSEVTSGASVVPLPATLPLLGGTLFGLIGLRRIRRS